MFNQFTGVGNLTRDPEAGSIPGTGTTVTKFGVAFNTKYKQKNETKTETLYLNAVVFGKPAENCKTYLKKGSLVLVQGRIRQREWDKDGEKHKITELIADNVKFLPGGPKEAEAAFVAEGEAVPAEGDEDIPEVPGE
ncbi:MAG: single-stranded DNA-binding protein [Nitrospinae bacterium]|nr:single-stranded DNA-binding protein [Nitrospinota bacterium]